MRCADVIRGLAAPDRLDPAALAEHLARCPRCAAHAERSARFDRLWEATRPEEPPPAAWATVWSQVNQALDHAETAHASSHSRPWRRRAFSLVAMAQAAVLLAAAWFVWRPGPGPNPDLGPRPGMVATVPVPQARPGAVVGVLPGQAPAKGKGGAEIEIDWGSLVLIQSGPTGVTVVSQGYDEASGAVDPSFNMLNALEAMAE